MANDGWEPIPANDGGWEPIHQAQSARSATSNEGWEPIASPFAKADAATAAKPQSAGFGANLAQAYGQTGRDLGRMFGKALVGASQMADYAKGALGVDEPTSKEKIDEAYRQVNQKFPESQSDVGFQRIGTDILAGLGPAIAAPAVGIGVMAGQSTAQATERGATPGQAFGAGLIGGTAAAAQGAVQPAKSLFGAGVQGAGINYAQRQAEDLYARQTYDPSREMNLAPNASDVLAGGVQAAVHGGLGLLKKATAPNPPEAAVERPVAEPTQKPTATPEPAPASTTPESAPIAKTTATEPPTAGQELAQSFMRGGLEPGEQAAVGDLLGNAKNAATKVGDFIHSLQNRPLPQLHRENPQALDEIAQMVSAKTAAPARVKSWMREIFDGLDIDKNKWGAAFVEAELRGTKQARLREGATYEEQARVLEQQGQNEAAKRARSEAERAYAEAKAVKSIVGGKQLASEVDYQSVWNDPKYQEAYKRYTEKVAPELESNYKAGADLDPDAPLMRFNEKVPSHLSLKRFDPDVPGGVPSMAGSSKFYRIVKQKTPFANRRTGTAEVYEVNPELLLENMDSGTAYLAHRKKAIKALIDAGDAIEGGSAPESIKGEPVHALEYPRPGGVYEKLWVREGVANDVKSVLGQDIRADPGIVKNIGDKLYAWTLLGPADNVANTLRTLRIAASSNDTFKSPSAQIVTNLLTGGYGGMLVKQLGQVANKLLRINSNESMAHIAELAQHGMLRSVPSAREFRSFNPIKHLNAASTYIDVANRMVADDVFRNVLVPSGLAKNTMANRRNFVNNLGQYAIEMQPKLMQFMRSSGMNRFITSQAARLSANARLLTGSPGYEATDASAAATARAIVLSRWIGTIGMIGALNYAMTGDAKPRKGVPWNAVDTGKNDENGKPVYIDLATGLGPGAATKMVGATAAIDAARENKTPGQMADVALRQSANAVLAPMAPPLAQAGYTALTGNRLAVGTMPVAEPPLPGQSAIPGRLKAAVKEISPTIDGDRPGGMVASLLPGFVPLPGRSERQVDQSARKLDKAQLYDVIDSIYRDAKKQPVKDRVVYIRDRLKDAEPQDRAVALQELLKKRRVLAE